TDGSAKTATATNIATTATTTATTTTKAATATPFGSSSSLFGQPVKTPADRLKLRDGGGEMWSAPSSVGGSPTPSSVVSPVGSPLYLPELPDYSEDGREQDEVEEAEQEDDEGVGSYGQRDGDDEDGRSYTEGSVVVVTDDDEVEGGAGSYGSYGSYGSDAEEAE
ncbi:hypothetical protein DFQ26_002942, partial [Actinomortierella ambigua]